MRTRVEEHEDDGISEIVSLALRKDVQKGSSKLDHLLTVAQELGISPESLREAELEYRVESDRKKALKTYRQSAVNILRLHVAVYAIINAFLFLINLFTATRFYVGSGEIWFEYPLLAWGTALALHAVVALRKVNWDDVEFQRWLRRRQRTEGEARPLPSREPDGFVPGQEV